jgi:methyl-accepting chemotaxis protein
MRRTSLATRLYLAFGLLLALLLVVGATAVHRVSRLESALTETSEVHSAAIELAALGLVHAQRTSRLTQEALLEPDPQRARALLLALDEARGESDRVAAELEAVLVHERASGAYRAVREATRAYREAFAPVREHIERGERDDAVADALAGLTPLRRALNQAWSAFIDAERAATRQAAQLGQDELGRAERDVAVAAGAALALALAVGLGTLPGVLRTVDAISRAIHELAAGDLRGHVRVTRGDELGELQGAIAVLTERLAGTMLLLQANAELLDRGAARLSQSSRAMGDSTREHAEVITQAALLLPRIATRLDGSLARSGPDAEAWDAVAELNRLVGRIDESAKKNRAGADDAAEEAARLAAQARALREALEEVRLPGEKPA